MSLTLRTKGFIRVTTSILWTPKADSTPPKLNDSYGRAERRRAHFRSLTAHLIASVVHFHVISIHIELHVFVAEHCGRLGVAGIARHVIGKHQDNVTSKRTPETHTLQKAQSSTHGSCTTNSNSTQSALVKNNWIFIEAVKKKKTLN